MSDMGHGLERVMNNEGALQLPADASPVQLIEANDPYQAVKECLDADGAGCLMAEAGGVSWSIYFKDGSFAYASSSGQSLNELGYRLRCLGLKEASEALRKDTQFRLEFAAVGDAQSSADIEGRDCARALTWLESRGFLDFQQVSQIATQLSREALETFLWLSDAEYQWHSEDTAAVSCTPALNIGSVLEEFRDRLLAWQQFNDKIVSPYQRPYLFLNSETHKPTSPMLAKLAKLLRGLNFSQLGLALNQDVLKVAKLLYPHVKSQELILRDPNTPFDRYPTVPKARLAPAATEPHRGGGTKRFKIACIDDSPTILNEMQKFLGQEEYEVIKIDNPVKAPSILFRLRPDLILMDITMPEINGYKLCSLLRSSTVLHDTPIVMVTGRTGLIDKARAKVTGATGYLTKPFTRGSLLAVVEQYLYR